VYQNNNELDYWLWPLGTEGSPQQLQHRTSTLGMPSPASGRQQYRPYILRISYSGSTGVKQRILYGEMPYEVYVRKNFARKPAAVDLPYWVISTEHNKHSKESETNDFQKVQKVMKKVLRVCPPSEASAPMQ
jgi:hypothetical protein